MEAGTLPPRYVGVASPRTLHFQGCGIALCLFRPRPAVTFALITVFTGVPSYLRHSGGSTQLRYILLGSAHPWDSVAAPLPCLSGAVCGVSAACLPGTDPHPSHTSSHSLKKLWTLQGLRTPRHSSYFSNSLTFMNSDKEHMCSSVSVILVLGT